MAAVTEQTPIVWPEPTINSWDQKNMQKLSSSVSESNLISASVVLVGANEDLATFVTQNLPNKQYNDTLLYPYDGYAIKMDAVIADSTTVGFCVDN